VRGDLSMAVQSSDLPKLPRGSIFSFEMKHSHEQLRKQDYRNLQKKRVVNTKIVIEKMILTIYFDVGK
jgi:hypothetical protein